MFEGLLTKKKLIELLEEVDDDVYINVLNYEGDFSANVEFWYENLDTRQFVNLTGKKPLWKMDREELDNFLDNNQ
jgi:hypothetical protein